MFEERNLRLPLAAFFLAVSPLRIVEDDGRLLRIITADDVLGLSSRLRLGWVFLPQCMEEDCGLFGLSPEAHNVCG